MIKMTYSEYDTMEAICDKIKEQSENSIPGAAGFFDFRNCWPKVEELKAINIEKNLKEYFPYVFFWYTQKLDEYFDKSSAEYAEYKEAMAYIRKIMMKNIEFR